MSAKRSWSDRRELSLSDREAAVLRSVIEEHVQTGEPVSSHKIAKISGLNLSAASIRNSMAKLEEMGLLSQPHTSAGRVPTDGSYRIYVNQILNSPLKVEQSNLLEIDQALARNRGEIPDLLGEASRQLSIFSNQVGLVLVPDLQKLIIERIEFVRLDAQRVVAILVGRSGVVHHRILDLEEPLEQTELERIGQYLSQNFGGRSLFEMHALLVEKIAEERSAYHRLERLGHRLGERVVEGEAAEAAMLVEGASNLFESPEFSDPRVMKSLFKTLEEKQVLVDLLSRLLNRKGVQVVIGSESDSLDLSRCSVIASTYAAGERVMGSVGIVGPTRMQYERVIPLVEYLARVLTKFLSTSVDRNTQTLSV